MSLFFNKIEFLENIVFLYSLVIVIVDWGIYSFVWLFGFVKLFSYWNIWFKIVFLNFVSLYCCDDGKLCKIRFLGIGKLEIIFYFCHPKWVSWAYVEYHSPSETPSELISVQMYKSFAAQSSLRYFLFVWSFEALLLPLSVSLFIPIRGLNWKLSGVNPDGSLCRARRL